MPPRNDAYGLIHVGAGHSILTYEGQPIGVVWTKRRKMHVAVKTSDAVYVFKGENAMRSAMWTIQADRQETVNA